MDMTNLIFSIFTIALLFLVLISPLLRKKAPKKELPSRKAKVDRTIPRYRRVRSFQKQAEDYSSHVFESWDTKDHKEDLIEKPIPATERIDSLPPLKKAVIWSEILSKPLGLREMDSKDSF